MPQTQMNIRIDDALKRQGDAVFQRNGLTPSAAVRLFYTEAVETDSVPRFARKTDPENGGLAFDPGEGSGLAWKALGMKVPQDARLDIEDAKREHAARIAGEYGF